MIRQSNIYKHDITVTYYEAKLIHITVNKCVNTVEPRYKKVGYDTYLLQDNPADPSSLYTSFYFYYDTMRNWKQQGDLHGPKNSVILRLHRIKVQISTF